MPFSFADRRRRREVRQILYRLKRRFGVCVDYYQETPGTPNVETGEVGSETQVITRIPRATLFETKISQRFEYDLSFIAANKNFTYGGIFEVGDSLIIVDQADMPTNFEPATTDRVVYLDKSYVVHSWEELYSKAGWYLHVRHTQGTKPKQVIDKHVQHYVEIDQDISHE